jgi:hypothetical protein
MKRLSDEDTDAIPFSGKSAPQQSFEQRILWGEAMGDPVKNELGYIGRRESEDLDR